MRGYYGQGKGYGNNSENVKKIMNSNRFKIIEFYVEIREKISENTNRSVNTGRLIEA